MNSNPDLSSTLVHKFLAQVDQYRTRKALLFKNHGQYESLSWTQWARAVKHTALGLHLLRVRKGDRVGILSENCPQWTFADLGVLSLGAVVVPIYPTCSVQDIEYIIRNAEIEVLFISGEEQLAKVRPLLGSTPIRSIIDFRAAKPYDSRLLALNQLMEQGRLELLNNPELYRHLLERVTPNDLATIIYTSGTTGPPKGVMLTHANFMYNYVGSKEKIIVHDDDVALSFLPLSHVFERLAGYYFMVFSGATIAYAESMATVADDMLLVRPSIMAAVPRFYEKFYAKVIEKVDQGPPLKKWIFAWAEKIGSEAAEYQMRQEEMPLGLELKALLASALVFHKIKKSMGDRLRFFISGGAPLNPFLGHFFYHVGILILEGYGLTETSPVIAVNSEEEFRFGTVGKPILFAEVKIAEDGEILTKGPCVMKGYFHNERATEEVLKDGWFSTGDMGEIDPDGFLKITDRKKDIIVNSGGKKIAPQNLEKEFLEDPFLSQVVVLGDKRHYLTCLIVLNRAKIEEMAEALAFPNLKWEDLAREPKVYQFIRDRLCPKISPRPSYEQVKYFCLLPQELTQAAGDLTPTLKIKRRVVEEKYKNQIELMYSKNPPQHQSIF